LHFGTGDEVRALSLCFLLSLVLCPAFGFSPLVLISELSRCRSLNQYVAGVSMQSDWKSELCEPLRVMSVDRFLR